MVATSLRLFELARVRFDHFASFINKNTVEIEIVTNAIGDDVMVMTNQISECREKLKE